MGHAEAFVWIRPMKATHGSRSGRRRINDPEGTRRNIVDVATEEFAQKGYSGARVDDIANRTRTSKRMIYYYFGGKEGLYIAVLEEAYRSIRSAEATLDLEQPAAGRALRTLVGFTFDYQNAHPEFVRLVMNENIMNGAHMARSKAIGKLNVTVIDALESIVARGQKAGHLPRATSIRSTCTCRSARSASSTSPTAQPSRPSSSATWPRPRRWHARRAQIVDIILGHVSR